MGLYKLREWVGTMTGKGDRWGRDSVGRSAPAFMAVPLHSPTYLHGGKPTSSAAAVVLAARPVICGRLL